MAFKHLLHANDVMPFPAENRLISNNCENRSHYCALALALSVHLNPLKVHASLDLYKEAKCSFGIVENQLSKLEDK